MLPPNKPFDNLSFATALSKRPCTLCRVFCYGKNFSLGGKHVDATVTFSDIRLFTKIAEKQPPADLIELLNDYFALMFDAIARHGRTLNQMVGDGLMAIFGAPMPSESRREQAVSATLEMLELLNGFN
jgi:class 3 adenylate cyclase